LTHDELRQAVSGVAITPGPTDAVQLAGATVSRVLRHSLRLAANEFDLSVRAGRKAIGFLSDPIPSRAKGHELLRLLNRLQSLIAPSQLQRAYFGSTTSAATVDDQYLAAFVQVVSGSVDPLGNALAYTIHRLATSGFALTTMSDDDVLAFTRGAIREATPFHFATRIATRRLRVGRTTIDAGSRVVLVLLAANNERPLRPGRERDGSLAFGGGRHRCPGQPLAERLIVAVLDRLRDWSIASTGPLQRRPSLGSLQVEHAPIDLRPRHATQL
jgi:hypothetical protein